jgi:hypothetical protein
MTAWKNSGNNDICPAGFSVPTEAELRADTIEATTTAITNNEKALNSFLKLPVAGYRAHDDHRVNGIGAARL